MGLDVQRMIMMQHSHCGLVVDWLIRFEVVSLSIVGLGVSTLNQWNEEIRFDRLCGGIGHNLFVRWLVMEERL